ncbi:MAG: glycerol-3-phosphate acyltransferase [Leptolyngbyaceae cyanobacterium bins.59]|nr:glycerol-3-phosphate acyltransferase [Leptolyngbyaceae cyanobacterium bins.59]
MTWVEVSPILAVLLSSFLLGGLPLINWLSWLLTRQCLSQVGTGNISVSAAFYHGGKPLGILAVLSEALKGIVAVLLARSLLPAQPAWELVALIALVLGRFWIGQGAGTTNVVWGYVVHDWVVATLTLILSSVGFAIVSDRRKLKFAVLGLFSLLTVLRNPTDPATRLAAIALAIVLAWIYTRMPDDLDLSPEAAQSGSKNMARFLQGKGSIPSLDQTLTVEQVGQKAATLSQLKRWGYPVPEGWALPVNSNPDKLVAFLTPSSDHPLVVRSSAIGEDSEQASAAGQYETVLAVTNREGLIRAIAQCRDSYHQPSAVKYRQDRGISSAGIAVLVQRQVKSVFSGVAFSRDPIARQGEAVLIEAVAGPASLVVSGQVTPETYRVEIPAIQSTSEDWRLPAKITLPVEGTGSIPTNLIQQVAWLSRNLEQRYHGIPQDIEWTWDGETLWLLQSRPITTLLPLWTRKIAAEVIPGLIRPLTWSVNRPLTCGVWGQLFTIVLGFRANGLDFNETATLHYSRAYFNASLLGQIFLRMGLPPESLEFLTRGAKFSKPPILSTLRNVPGLLRLVGREFRLEKDFQRDEKQYFLPSLELFDRQPAEMLPLPDLLTRINSILALLQVATYYSILAPLSASLRQSINKVQDTELDNRCTPEVSALRSLQDLARQARAIFSSRDVSQLTRPTLFAALAETPEGTQILQQFDAILHQYGYLSEVGTDIAVPTWREEPDPVRELFTQFFLTPPEVRNPPAQTRSVVKGVQRRLDLKGRVTEVYSRLLAELRWSFVALERHWLSSGLLSKPGDIFFLEFSEIRQQIEEPNAGLTDRISALITHRRSQREQDSQLPAVPYLVYGNTPPPPLNPVSQIQSNQQIQGIGASPGQVEGTLRVLLTLQTIPDIGAETILVVPYTDSGWAPLLARAGGLISEVGGRLSHGAIVAREYGIPAVMDIPNATQFLKDGQRVRIDGQRGLVEIL